MVAQEQDLSQGIPAERSAGSTANRSVLVVALLAVAATAGLLDQLSKWIAGEVLAAGRPVELIPGLLDLRLTDNPHGAFGLFAGFPAGLRLPILLALAVLAMTAITVYAIRTLGWTRSVSISLGLVLGGALTNQIDRITRGAVVDFIHLHWADRLEWPTFNLADVAITAGSMLLALTVIRLWINKIRNDNDEDLEGTR